MSPPKSSKMRRIAVVGSGAAGLCATWSLANTHSVTLFEQAPRWGGHANTVDIRDSHGESVAVDTGFIVYNEQNYPEISALFRRLGVAVSDSDMSFGVSLDDGRLEYSGATLNAMFAQRQNFFRPRFWQMLSDIKRFYSNAPSYLSSSKTSRTSIGELLANHGYSECFINDHLIPMSAAIWSSSQQDILAYPADAFIRFFDNHGLLNLSERPQWKTVTGGSRKYVEALLADAEVEERIATPVVKIERQRHCNVVTLSDGARLEFDEVVLATHADEALALIAEPSQDEQDILGAFRYSDNEAWLHRDPRFMPTRKLAWASWNYLTHVDWDINRPLSVTYWMNQLQPLETRDDIFVTLNPNEPPAREKVFGRYQYTHPIFTARTALAQERSLSIQGRHHTWFCGAYLGAGFHEDAAQSGFWIAEALGAERPWERNGFDRLPISYSQLYAIAA